MGKPEYAIFAAIIIELITIYIAIAFKADRRKAVAAFTFGTLLAGIVGYRLSIRSQENSSPFPHGSFANVDSTEAISSSQIVKRLDTIQTFRASGTINSTNDEGKTFIYVVELEFARPDKQHLITRFESGTMEESIRVGEQFCWRPGEYNEWLCSEGPVHNPIQEWSWIVRAEANPGTTLIESGVRTYAWHEKECRLYYKTELSNESGQSTAGVCIDPDTLLPVEFFSSGTQGMVDEFDVFDINKPIDISLPAQ